MRRRVAAVLWRRANKASLDSLLGISVGQYDVRLGADPRIEEFFTGLPRRSATSLGGYTLDVSVEPYDGANPIATQTLGVRYMGERSQRKDWYIRAQRPDSAYPLWRPGRAFTSRGAVKDDYLMLVRDDDGHFHARWIREADVGRLPPSIAAEMRSEEVGVHFIR